MSSAPLMRVRRDTPYGAPPPAYGAPAPRGRVGPVYTFVKTDPQVTIQYIDELFIQKRRQRSSLLFRGPLPSLVYKYFCYAVVAQKDTNCTGCKFKLIVPITKKINKYFFILQFLQQGQYFFFFIRYLNCYEIFEKIFASYCILNYLFT